MAAALPAAGYSAKSLPEKLGFKAGMVAAFIALPERLGALTTTVGFSSVTSADRWSDFAGAPATYDVIHAFARNASEIEAGFDGLQAAIKRGGMIWISWPKKASGVASDVTEGKVREAALKLDLVDVKVAAVDDVWSGLKFVIRKDRR